MQQTPCLALPYLMPNQAQKHVTHNDAIRALDALVQISIVSRNLTAPPAGPAEGARYIPASGATGAWAGMDGQIMAYQDGGWVAYPPQPGWLAFLEDAMRLQVFRNGIWQDAVAPALNPAALIGVNAAADTTNRLNVKSPASLFDAETASHQLKINKAGAEDTASLLFQTGYSARAEIGLAGSDAFSIKVSEDGALFHEALSILPESGFMGLGTAAPASRLHLRQDFDARLTIDTVESGAGGGFDILNSTDGQNWRVTGSPVNFKVRDHTEGLDKFVILPGAGGAACLLNIPKFGIGTASPSTQLQVEGPVRIGRYSISSLPSATDAGEGALVYVSDESGGAIAAFSDGANWRRMSDRAIVS